MVVYKGKQSAIPTESNIARVSSYAQPAQSSLSIYISRISDIVAQLTIKKDKDLTMSRLTLLKQEISATPQNI